MGVSPLLTEVSWKALSAPAPSPGFWQGAPTSCAKEWAGGQCPALCPCPEPVPASRDKMRAWIPPQPSWLSERAHPETLDSSLHLGITSLPPLNEPRHFHC